MQTVWFYTIASVVLVSLIALIGIVFLSIKKKLLDRILILLVSFAAGALIGGAFIHLLPQTFETFGFGIEVSLYVIVGILTFFILEKYIHWHHCHHSGEHHISPMVFTNIFGDGLHNFVDGVIIASSYMIDIKLGIATTIAVLLHEIPQEIGDFGVLVHGGIKKKRAIQLNLLSASMAIIGAVIALLIGGVNEGFLKFMLPFTAGGFIYIANTDLIPELHKHPHGRTSINQLLLFILGIVVMMSLLLLE